MCFAFSMKYLNIIQRFIPLQFGEVNKESNLFEGFKDCLEKINAEGVMILNDFLYLLYHHKTGFDTVCIIHIHNYILIV